MLKISKKKYISFDIFDTLIVRDVKKPSDLFIYVEEYCKKNNIECPSSFCDIRMQAEREANYNTQGNASIRDIYTFLETKYNMNFNKILDVELLLEHEFCHPNHDMVDFYNRCVLAGKSIVLISDMYLPKKILESLLKKCGIEGYLKLYVSCDYNATKSSGTLFEIVIRDLKITHTQIVHYGDNLVSDYLRPMILGIKSFRVYPSKNKFSNPYIKLIKDNRELLDYNTVNKTAIQASHVLKDYEKMGMNSFGPLLTGFSQWLHNVSINDNISTIYFMSRDGFMMKKAYDILFPNNKSHYLYCSRRSYSVPLLWKCQSYKDIFQYIPTSKNTTIAELLTRLGLSIELCKADLADCKLDPNKIYYNHSIEHDYDVEVFFNKIKKQIQLNSKKEFESIKEYILGLNMHGTIGVVDIGYHGTMQNALLNILSELNIEANVIGYYLGVASINTFFSRKDMKFRSFLYSDSCGIELKNKLEYMTPIFESIFLAHHGSVRNFYKEGNQCVPVFEPYEYDSDLDRLIDEKDFIYQFQDGALKFVKIISESLLFNLINFTPTISALNLIRLGNNPSLREAKLWGDIRFFDYKCCYIARPKIQNLLHGFKCSSWKVGFLKRLFIVPIRYDLLCGKIRSFLRK